MQARSIERSFEILGVTGKGDTFRPSDWSERLCGVMSQFRPGPSLISPHLGYSPYVMPGSRANLKTVRVDGRLNLIEPMAYAFLVSFARDNDLRVEPLDTTPGN